MARVIALLRGVNVGGRKLAMSDLRALCEEAGCEDVTTYIQSGNVVFTHKGGTSDTLRADLERRIKAVAGYESPVMLRTAKELDTVVRGNPYKKATGTTLHVAFLGSKPGAKALDGIDLTKFEPEELTIKGRDVYLHLPNGMGRSELAKVLPRLKVPMTVRNWNTVLKLQELANSTRA
jgi:uncharacterized protein (DUF1697 family)